MKRATKKQKKLHINIEDILHSIREQYKKDKCYNPSYISQLASENKVSRETIIQYIRNEFFKEKNTISYSNILEEEDDTPILMPRKNNQPIGNVERNQICKYLLGRMNPTKNKLEHGAIKEAAIQFHRSEFTISKIMRQWDQAILDRTDGLFSENIGYLQQRMEGGKEHHYSVMTTKERNEINSLLEGYKVKGNVTYEALHDIARRFNRSLRTVRRMADKVGLVILKNVGKRKREYFESSSESELSSDDGGELSLSDSSNSSDEDDNHSMGSSENETSNETDGPNEEYDAARNITTFTLTASVPTSFFQKKEERVNVRRSPRLRKKSEMQLL